MVVTARARLTVRDEERGWINEVVPIGFEPMSSDVLAKYHETPQMVGGGSRTKVRDD